jgi:serine/threonine-protein kinase
VFALAKVGPRAEALRGARFGQHEVVRLVGHGATASVFEARHVTLGKRVAVKVLHDHLAATSDYAARFVREGQVAAQLHHPSIVDVIDVGVENGMPYLVMELLEGHDLRAELDARMKLSVPAALAVFLPLASALSHAHGRGALHRDVKPANVFLARDHRGDIVPKLVDFGLSKIVGDAKDKSPLTADDVVVGTLLYMAPEQTYSSNAATAKSDQYSLAAILYEALTGRPPFEGDGFYALLEAIRNAPIPPPSLIDPRLPEDLDGVVMRALARNPDKRWPSVREFAQALVPFADEATRLVWARDFSGEAPISAPSVSREQVTATAAATAATMAATSSVRRVEPLPCAPGASGFHIKGIAYRGIIQFVERALPGGMDSLCDALDDDRVKDFVRQPFLATSWCDILPLVPICVALARIVQQPLDAFVRAGTMAQARFDVKTVFKWMAETTHSVADLGDKLPRFGARYYDFGKADGWVEAPGHFVNRQTMVPAYVLPWFLPMHAAYTEETARLRGATHAEASERRVVPEGTNRGLPTVTVETDLRFKE